MRLPVGVHRWITSSDFPPRPATPSPRAPAGPPGSRAKCFHACSGSRPTTAPGPSAPRHSGAVSVAFGSGDSLGAWELTRFRGSIPGLRVPLSTLRTRPYGRAHMTRGHGGWLALPSANSSFAALCRLIPALPPGRVRAFAGRVRIDLAAEAPCYARELQGCDTDRVLSLDRGARPRWWLRRPDCVSDHASEAAARRV